MTEKEKREYRAELLNVDYGVTPADTLLIDTVTREGVIEPLAGYTALRIKQDLLSRSNIGGLLTVASQDEFHPAVSGGLDWRLFTNDGMWSFCGQTVISRIDPDETGFGIDMDFGKESGKHVRFSIGLEIDDPHLDLNRLGYLRRSNQRQIWTWWQYRTDDDWWIVRNTWNNLNLNAGWNYQHEEINRSWNFNNTIDFINYWQGGFYCGRNYHEYDDRETRGRGSWKRPSSWNLGFWLDTDERRMFQIEVDYYFGESRTSPWWGAEALLRFKPTSNFNLWTHWEYAYDYGQLMWVDNPDDTTTLFADKDQDILQVQVGADLTLKPNLSIQFSAEGLLSGLDYHGYRPWLGGGAYGPQMENDWNGDSYDYHYSALNSMFLLRWEYLPGSTLYAVWTRSRSEFDPGVTGLVFDRDFDRFFSGTTTDHVNLDNVFLLKISYWMNI